MSEWKEYKLGDIASVQTGPFGSQLHQEDYAEFGTPIITVEHLGDNRITYQNLPKVTDKDKERLKKYWLQTGDVVFSRVGSVDRRAFVTEKENGWLFSGRCLRVRANEQVANGQFLSYYFGQESFKAYVRRIAVGATMPSINTKILSDIEIILPDLQTQRATAEILSALDDKIELNNQINSNLEALAQAIFKQWFIDFEFPDENGNPYKSSGGKMIESELGEIPEKWAVVELGDILELAYGKALKASDRRQGIYPVVGSSGIVGSHDSFIVKAPGIVIGRKGTIGEVIWMGSNFYPIDTTFFIVDKNSIGMEFLYFLLKNQDFQKIASDSAVPGLNRNEAYKNTISLAPKKLVKQFSSQMSNFFCMSQSNKLETERLVNLRDCLLPSLISGAIKIA